MTVRAWSPFRQYLHAAKGRPGLPDILVFSAIVLGCAFLFFRATQLPAYEWNWGLLKEFIFKTGSSGHWEAGMLLTGLYVTLRVSIWSIIFSIFFGVICGGLLMSHSLFQLPCKIYVNLCRSTPPLVILFAIYFFAGNLLPVRFLETSLTHAPHIFQQAFYLLFSPPGQLDRMLAAILALGLYHTAYMAEIMRGAIQSVPIGQWDAAYALGFNKLQTLRHVILPQGCRMLIAPLTGQAINIFKDSALVSLISLPDLTFQSLEIMSVSRMTFEIWICAGLIYLFICGFCALLGKCCEKIFSYG